MHPGTLFTLLLVVSIVCFFCAQQALRSRVWRKFALVLLLLGVTSWVFALCTLISAMERRALVQALDELSQQYETQN